jgi:hypothetical protein
MCATDRSQNTVCSQTVSIQYLVEMLNISSSPSFIRNNLGELVHTSPLFDKLFLQTTIETRGFHPSLLMSGWN